MLHEAEILPDSDLEEPIKPTLPPEEIEKLITDNMPLAYWFANKFSNIRGFDREDIEQQALTGLVKAANMFNPAKGRFSDYASMAIRNHLGHYFFHGGRYDTNIKKILNEPVFDEEGNSEEKQSKIVDVNATSSDYEVSKAEAAKIVSGIVAELKEPDRSILLRYYAGESYRDLQHDFNLSFTMIGIIVRRAAAQLKDKLIAMGITDVSDILPESILYSDGKEYYRRLLIETTFGVSLLAVSADERTAILG
jgi:RNA polymerase sigma factor (sigma-70 family)